ncbi:hypothetical protein ACFY4C_37350 [Actinomadura viridis]|uniref:hypothetical protein n=1 Tax=Actinomadura viridis TaxID=58110 RepID=UPI0036BAB1B6
MQESGRACGGDFTIESGERVSKTTRWDRFQAAPLWIWFIYFFIFGPLLAVAMLLIVPEMTISYAATIAPVAGILFASFMTLFVAAIRRREEKVTGRLPRADRAAIEHAVRTGELPTRRDLLHPLGDYAERKRRQHRTALISGPLTFGALALMWGVISLLIGHWWWWAGLGVPLGGLITNHVMARKYLAGLNRLEVALRMQSSERVHGEPSSKRPD